jgi:hypothetical protein
MTRAQLLQLPLSLQLPSRSGIHSANSAKNRIRQPDNYLSVKGADINGMKIATTQLQLSKYTLHFIACM